MDEQTIGLILSIGIQFAVPVAVILVAIVVGTIIERKHYESIREREQIFLRLPVIPSKGWDEARTVGESRMVAGSVVVSIDYFKRILAGLRNIVGGRIRSYESLIDRGRREAILRMKEQCPDADMIVNFRMETSTISKTGRGGKQKVGCIEILAYGTAVKYMD